jgi:hypothetical protein
MNSYEHSGLPPSLYLPKDRKTPQKNCFLSLEKESQKGVEREAG